MCIDVALSSKTERLGFTLLRSFLFFHTQIIIIIIQRQQSDDKRLKIEFLPAVIALTSVGTMHTTASTSFPSSSF